METLKKILSAAADILSVIGKWIWDAFAALFTWIGEIVSNIPMPVLPAASKVFKSMNTTVIAAALLLYLILVNAAAFFQFRRDKKYAENDMQRIPERTLFKWCWAGGAAGAFAAMQIFRHKTQHAKFKIGVPVLLMIEMIIYSIIFGFLAYWSFCS